MHKISEIISKPVLTLFEGENVGTVSSFLFDEKQNKIKGFVVLDDNSEFGENYFGFDSIVLLAEDQTKTLACLSDDEKLQINARGIALEKVKQYFESK